MNLKQFLIEKAEEDKKSSDKKSSDKKNEYI